MFKPGFIPHVAQLLISPNCVLDASLVQETCLEVRSLKV
jgi:hypothetical protein